MDSPLSYPDGLTESVIDLLIEQAFDAIAGAPGPTSALADGSAAKRRRRRIERRSVAAVLRELPVRGGVPGPDGRAA
jgi:hypothetical protein